MRDLGEVGDFGLLSSGTDEELLELADDDDDLLEDELRERSDEEPLSDEAVRLRRLLSLLRDRERALQRHENYNNY